MGEATIAGSIRHSETEYGIVSFLAVFEIGDTRNRSECVSVDITLVDSDARRHVLLDEISAAMALAYSKGRVDGVNYIRSAINGALGNR